MQRVKVSGSSLIFVVPDDEEADYDAWNGQSMEQGMAQFYHQVGTASANAVQYDGWKGLKFVFKDFLFEKCFFFRIYGT